MKNREQNSTIIGVDLGGTNIRSGKIQNGEIVHESSIRVPENGQNKEAVIKAIKNTIADVYDQNVAAIGVGVPSLVNRHSGIVYDVQNIPSWKMVNLKEILENIFDVPVFIDNDANCFALGEKVYGKGRGYDDFVGITLGTGFGAGIVKNGRLMDDANCCSGEFGSVPYLDKTLEDYCSGKFFAQNFQKTGEEIYHLAMQGNKEALEALEQIGYHIANAIKIVLFTVDPKLIIFGGSVAKAHEFFKNTMINELKKFPYQHVIHKLQLEFSEIKHSAILGAGALCFNNIAQFAEI